MEDRELQREILQILEDASPESLIFEELNSRLPGRLVLKNLFYLNGHGLVDAEFFEPLGMPMECDQARITSKGTDFLKKDGGISAILNTVTVKLHDDTIRALLERSVSEFDTDPTTKITIMKTLREAPASAVKTVLEHVIQQGLQTLPSATRLLEMLGGRQ